MRFILKGVHRELSYEDVLAAAERIEALNVGDGRNKYYVIIGSRRLPVKRLFAEATGLQPNDFIPGDAMRNLKKLEFEIHKIDAPSRPAIASVRPERSANSKTQDHTFAVSLEADEDGFIAASCPQLPGCHSQGQSREEAIRNIEEAIRGYTASMKRHGEEIPAVDWELIEVAL